MRILSLDVGNKRIGMAVSDQLLLTAQPLYTLERKGIQRDLEALKAVIDRERVEAIVVGLPRNMDGTLGQQGEKSQRFAKELEQIFSGEIILFDERLTTACARRILRQNDISHKDGKKIVDTIAAVMILEGYLTARKMNMQSEERGKTMDLNDANKPIILLDEDDNEVEFELIQSLEVDGKQYAILAPANEEDGDDAYIFGISLDAEGEMVLREIEDDEEYEKVAAVIEEE